MSNNCCSPARSDKDGNNIGVGGIQEATKLVSVHDFPATGPIQWFCFRGFLDEFIKKKENKELPKMEPKKEKKKKDKEYKEQYVVTILRRL